MRLLFAMMFSFVAVAAVIVAAEAATPSFESERDEVLARRSGWLAKAEAAKPRLFRRDVAPVGLVKTVADASAFQGWRMEAAQKNLLLLWLREQWFYLLVGTALSMDLPRRLRDVFIRKAGPGTTVSFRIGQAFSVAGLIALTGGACLSVSLLLGGSYNPFLYFRF